jgi:nicotinamide riboside kinase
MLFVLTGPESAGKSTLTQALAEHFAAPWVAEFARQYLHDHLQVSATYQPSDLLHIAGQQQSAERDLDDATPFAFADTDLQVIYIWWQERFGPVPRVLSQAYARQSPRHYLLCEPDVAWTPDPLRENPVDRTRLFQAYEADLQRRGLAYSIVRGDGQARLDYALEAVLNVSAASAT